MTITTRKSYTLIESEILEILHKYFLENDLVKPRKQNWYYTLTKAVTGWRARLYLSDPNEYMLQGIIKHITAEHKKIELLSYTKEFTETVKKLNDTLTDYEIIIEERFR